LLSGPATECRNYRRADWTCIVASFSRAGRGGEWDARGGTPDFEFFHKGRFNVARLKSLNDEVSKWHGALLASNRGDEADLLWSLCRLHEEANIETAAEIVRLGDEIAELKQNESGLQASVRQLNVRVNDLKAHRDSLRAEIERQFAERRNRGPTYQVVQLEDNCRSVNAVYFVNKESTVKCDGCCGLFRADQVTEKRDGSRFCAGCLANNELVEKNAGQAEYIIQLERLLAQRTSQHDAMAPIAREYADENRVLRQHNERLSGRVDELIDEAARNGEVIRKQSERITLQFERINTLEWRLARKSLKAARERIGVLPMCVGELRPAVDPNRRPCWYLTNRGWNEGWALGLGGEGNEYMLVERQDGGLRWCNAVKDVRFQPPAAESA